MSAFSRGLFFRPQCAFQPPRNIHTFFQARSFQQPRSFSASTIFRAAKKPRTQSAVKKSVLGNSLPSAATKSANIIKPAAYQNYASTLAQKGRPTLLYVAPSHTAFRITSYSAAVFCFAYASYNSYESAYNSPPGIAPWVTMTFGLVCIGMSAMGTWLMLSPTRLIRTITAIPRALPAAPAGRRLARNAQHELEIEIELRRVIALPFLKPRRIRVRPEGLVIKSELVKPMAKMQSAAEVRAMQLLEEAEKKKQLEYERSHIMTAPFRHMKQAMASLFRAAARSFTREGFAKLNANGKVYKLDITGGWALDGGRALDRLATLKVDL